MFWCQLARDGTNLNRNLFQLQLTLVRQFDLTSKLGLNAYDSIWI